MEPSDLIDPAKSWHPANIWHDDGRKAWSPNREIDPDHIWMALYAIAIIFVLYHAVKFIARFMRNKHAS